MNPLETIRSLWRGKPLAVIGGGPSIQDPPALTSALSRAGVGLMGANDAYLLPGVQATVYGDAKWAKHHREALASFSGLIFDAASHHIPRAISADRTPRMNSDKAHANALTGLGWYTNSGAVAIQIAIAALPSEIWLFGFDGDRTEAASNWHPNTLDHNPERTYSRFRAKMPEMMGDLEARGDVVPPIWNCNPDSKYDIWAKCKQEDVIHV